MPASGRVASLGFAGGYGDRIDGDRLVEEERQVVLDAGVLRGEEIGIRIAVESELANLTGGRGERRLDDGMDRRLRGLSAHRRCEKTEDQERNQTSHGTPPWLLERYCDCNKRRLNGHEKPHRAMLAPADKMARMTANVGRLDASPSTDIFIRPGVPALVLAPMEGVADAPMRAVFSLQLGGFSFCVAEFVRISQAVPGPRTFRERIPELLNDCRTPAGLPVQIQLLGGDPERLAQAAVVAVRAGARAVDLNFGCPAKTVNQHDGGATLLRYPNRIRAIVAAVCQAVPSNIPVSAKLRLGWDDATAIHANAECAAEGGAAWITIHARTKEQGYRPPAYWEPIAAVRARLLIPVVANGEIWTVEDLRRCRGETGCEHFMLGRGALANPALARAAARELGLVNALASEPTLETPVDWHPLVQRFVKLNMAAGRTPAGTAARIKQWLGMANHNGKLPWLDAVRRQQGLEEILSHLSRGADPRGFPSKPTGSEYLTRGLR